MKRTKLFSVIIFLVALVFIIGLYTGSRTQCEYSEAEVVSAYELGKSACELDIVEVIDGKG